MKRKLVIMFFVFSFLVIGFSLNALAIGSNVCNDTFFIPVTSIGGREVQPIYTIVCPATGQTLEIYPIVQFNQCSTRRYYLESGNLNTYSNRRAYYNSIGRPFMFYTEYGNATHGIFGTYVPFVTGVATGFNLESLPGFTQSMYRHDPSVIFRNFFDGGTDGSGTAFTMGNHVAHNIKSTAIRPNSPSRDANGNLINRIPAHFTIQYAPRYSRDGNSVVTFNNLVGQRAEFRMMGYTNIGTVALNPFFFHDVLTQNSIFEATPRDRVARQSMRTIYDNDDSIKMALFRHFILNNPHQRQNYRNIPVRYDGQGRTLDWLVRNRGIDYTVNNFHTAFLPMGHPGLTLGSWFTNSHNGEFNWPFITAGLPKPNLRLENMTLRRGNTIIAEYQKESAVTLPPRVLRGREFHDLREIGTIRQGETYNLSITVRDVTEDPSRAGINRRQTPIIDVFFVPDRYANEAIPHFDRTDPRFVHRRIEGRFTNNRTMEFNEIISLPDTVEANSRLRIVAVIPSEYSLTGDNTIFEDDHGHLPLRVEGNNLIMQRVEVLDRNNRVVDEIVGGNEYRIRYTFRYEGANANNVPVTIQNINVRNSRTGSLIYLNNESLTSTLNLRNGGVYQFTTRFFRVPNNAFELFAEGRVSADRRWNNVLTDDRGEVFISFIPDLSISINSISPDTINKQFNTSGNRTAQIAYDVDFIGPSNSTIATEVLIRIINTNTGQIIASQRNTVSVRAGRNTLVQNITFPVRSVSHAGIRDVLRVEAEVNPSRNMPRVERTWVNNISISGMNVNHVPVNHNVCPTNIRVRTQNRWIQNYIIDHHRGTATYEWVDVCVGGWSWTPENGWQCLRVEPRRVPICINTSHWRTNPSRHINETYQITEVLFRTREGAFDLLRGAGRIKAGYGFELDITLRFDTNSVAQFNSLQWSRDRCNYDSVFPAPIPLQLHEIPENIFIIMPDGQIIGNTARANVNPVLQTVSRIGPWTNRIYRIQIQGGNTFGRRVTNQLYINDRTRNGVYQMTICTDPFWGQQLPPLVNIIEKDIMYDRRTLTFEVVGGHTEDIRLQIIR